MNRRTRTLLAMAMSAALVAPVALAQQAQPKPKAAGNASAQAMQDKQAKQDKHPTTREADAVDAHVTPATTLPTRDHGSTEDKEIPPTAQGAAHAAAHSSVVQRDVWQRLDTDGDGRISASEADVDATFDGDFAAMDVDDDGFVSDAEYRDFSKAHAAQVPPAAGHSAVVQRDLWSRLDVDGDGRISAAEADADTGIDGKFARIDSNGDGFISDAEMRADAKETGKP